MKTHPELLTVAITDNVIFHTLSGALSVDFAEDGGMMMEFPADTRDEANPTVATEDLASALGVSEIDIVHVEFSKNLGYAVIEISQEVDMAGLSVDSHALVYQGISALISGSIVP
jgi:predicted PhzF superfamily epimerase YddE/YHI9